MKITRESLKALVKETMIEENEYKVFFKKALEKAGKSIPKMSDEEKKAFFNKIEKTWKGRGTKSEGNAFGAAVAKAKKDGDDEFEVDGKKYKTERFGRGHVGPTFGNEEVDEMVSSSDIGKGDNKKPSKDASDSSQINEGPSTEEKRIAMLAVRKQAKYRNVDLMSAIQDQINALEDLKRDAKRGKLK